jgi:hypothetical protein
MRTKDASIPSVPTKRCSVPSTIYRIFQFLLLNALLLIGSLPIIAHDGAVEPGSDDAIVAAPDHYRVVFENEIVRVLEVTIKPGEKEPFHTHSLPSVMTIITGARLRITEATMTDGKLVLGKSIEVGADNLQPPPLWMPPQGLHSAENIGSTTFHAYRTEIKRRSSP